MDSELGFGCHFSGTATQLFSGSNVFFLFNPFCLGACPTNMVQAQKRVRIFFSRVTEQLRQEFRLFVGPSEEVIYQVDTKATWTTSPASRFGCSKRVAPSP